MSKETFTYNGVELDVTFAESETVRHGGPFDRGSADSYYGRGEQPHYYVGDSITTHRIEKSEMTKRELLEYHAGYEYNETINMDWKDWG
jgi:hypothetical protein